MMNQSNQRLCGGIFFTLLLEALKPHAEKRERYKGKRDGLSEPEVLLGLAKIIVPDLDAPLASQMPTLKSSTTEYKKCENNGGTYYPFGDRAALSAFDERVKRDYHAALAAMVQFTDSFLETGKSTKKDERLVKALLELIENDSSISPQQAFYVREDGLTETKESLRICTVFCLQAFLLGIWHYAVLRSEGNVIGKETFEVWCPPTGGGPRKYTADLGEQLNREVMLTYAAVPENYNHEQSESPTESEPSQQEDQANLEGGMFQQIINNNPVFFSQHGEKNTQISHIDTLFIQM